MLSLPSMGRCMCSEENCWLGSRETATCTLLLLLLVKVCYAPKLLSPSIASERNTNIHTLKQTRHPNHEPCHLPPNLQLPESGPQWSLSKTLSTSSPAAAAPTCQLSPKPVDSGRSRLRLPPGRSSHPPILQHHSQNRAATTAPPQTATPSCSSTPDVLPAAACGISGLSTLDRNPGPDYLKLLGLREEAQACVLRPAKFGGWVVSMAKRRLVGL
jgi:hypothetical protein